MSDKIFVQCPNCNASFETEQSGNTVRCEYCGSPITLKEQTKTASEKEDLKWEYYDPEAEEKKETKTITPEAPDIFQGRKKKPFFRKWKLILVTAIIIIVGIALLCVNEETETVDWSDMILGDVIPEPPSLKGTVEENSDDRLSLTLCEISDSAYSDYVDACIEMEFTVDAEKESDSYSAYNAEGYKLYVAECDDELELSLDAPENKDQEDAETAEVQETTETEETEPQASETDNSAAAGIRPEFQSAMDSYEAFIDEYCAFMQKYAESDGTDLELLADYMTYMTKYAELCDEFTNWENQDMNEAETAYYLEVQTRVNQKLAAVAGN